jgi:hypothetical protein
MNYRRKKQISTLARSLVIATGLISLLFVGSASIGIAVMKADKQVGPQAPKTGRCYISTFKLSDGDGSMKKNEASNSEKSIFFLIQAVVGGQNFDNIRPIQKIIESRSYHDLVSAPVHIQTTAASISPQKALEFTLVGAKPSGTS